LIDEYQLTISSQTSLFTCNFWMEGLKHLYPFCSKKYLVKIHFLTFGSNFFVFHFEHEHMQNNQKLWSVRHSISSL
jgi:hypothetical protein